MKQNLIEQISLLLLNKGFTIKSLTRTCFDILARNESQILLIKILEDANSISEVYAHEMKKLSSYLNASPLIIAQTNLEDNVVYTRFNIFTLNLSTFNNALHNNLPIIKSTHAGLTAHIDSEKLKRKISDSNQSINSISRNIGVSRKMVEKYKEGSVDITINKAVKIQNLFGNNVFQKIDIFSFKQQPESPHSDVGKKYNELGFEATETIKVPFDLIAKKGKEIVLTEMSDKQNPQLDSLSRLLDADKLIIFKKNKPKGIPAITKKEFMEFHKANELIKFLKEY